MNEAHAILLNQVRYAERLCERTARLYRRVQAVGVFASVVGGSAALSALSSKAPPELSIAGAAAFTVFGALLLAVRPADKAAANEADARRYAKLRTEAASMDTGALQSALNKAHEQSAAEVEPLRDVAFNDVVVEVGRQDLAVPLTRLQRVIAAMA